MAVAETCISVIVPVHNDPGDLRLCLDALWSAAPADCEIIVVDDGSTDATASVAAGKGALKHKISMCGLLPTLVVLDTLRRLDLLNTCQPVGYGTSADAGGDTNRVVGYAACSSGRPGEPNTSQERNALGGDDAS